MAPRTRSRAAAEMKLFDLPEELLFKIIELMPSKSLRVARCVNKATEQMAARTPFARACRLLKWARLWDEHDVDISIDEARLEIIARDLARSEEIYHLMRGLGPLPRDLSPAIMPGDTVAGRELSQAELDDQIQRVHPLFFELFAMDWLVIYVPQNVLLRMFCVPQNVLLQPQSTERYTAFRALSVLRGIRRCPLRQRPPPPDRRIYGDEFAPWTAHHAQQIWAIALRPVPNAYGFVPQTARNLLLAVAQQTPAALEPLMDSFAETLEHSHDNHLRSMLVGIMMPLPTEMLLPLEARIRALVHAAPCKPHNIRCNIMCRKHFGGEEVNHAALQHAAHAAWNNH